MTRGRVLLVDHQLLESITSNVSLPIYRPGAVDPEGIGEGASLALPCVLGGFRRVDEPVDVAAVLLGWVVPDCSQDARNVMPIRTAMREIRCLFITYSQSRRAESVVALNLMKRSRC